MSPNEAFLRGHALDDLGAGKETDRAALAPFDAAIARDLGYAAAHAMRATMLSACAVCPIHRRFYDPVRRHFALDYLSPAQFEKQAVG